MVSATASPKSIDGIAGVVRGGSLLGVDAASVGERDGPGQHFRQPAEQGVERPFRVAALLHQGAAGQGDDARAV